MTDQAPPAQPTSPNSAGSGRTFADHVGAYAQAGWPCVLPVPPATKTPPPVGFTGDQGRDTSIDDLLGWLGDHDATCSARCDRHARADYSIALQMPPDVIGIDVDQYAKGEVEKRGAETMASCLHRWGPLPPTFTSTAREPEGPSRVYFFRVPPGRYATRLTGDGPGGPTGDVEILQRHHRYAVVAPSVHQAVGSLYRWYGPDGSVLPIGQVPAVVDLPELPQPWVEGLAAGAGSASATSSDRASGEVLLDQLEHDARPECAEMTSARMTAVDKVGAAEAGSRHDVMTERVHHVVQLAAAGHAGASYAVLELRTLWETLTAGEERTEEFERMLLTSARKAVTAVGVVQVPQDPCLTMPGFAGSFWPEALADGPTTSGAASDPDTQIVEPPRWTSVREVIGAHTFDPNAGLDQPLAERVLERCYPALRYVYDADAWLLRAPDKWELHGRLSPWAVATLAPLMPLGDPTADKGSEPHERAKRRTRLMSTPGARAIAGKMDDLVAGGMHPAAASLAGLDSDPEILWAGSMPYSLRASAEGPAFAELDPSTPHLRTAAVTPETRPTPLWDAFLEAVWPDPAIRAWSVRVFSVAFTGYADRALPVLLGETGRGKTQVVHLLMSLLGDYAHAANPKLLSSSNEHDTIIFDLKGRRLSFIDEGPSDRKAGQERLKQLTGGGELTGRPMRKDSVTFRPTHTLVLTTNDEPVLTDPAVRSRVRLIPCEGDPELVRVTRAAIGHVSGAAWRAEAPGVLATMMSEAARWLAEPESALVTSAPVSIRYLAERLGAEQDPVTIWVEEETEHSEQGTPSRELYQAFVASCRRNSMRVDAIPTETKWGRSLTRMGFPSTHSEQGKRRQLKVRGGGFLPGMEAPPQHGLGATPAPAQPVSPTRQDLPPSTPPPSPEAPTADGLTPIPDGFLTGSNTNPSEPFPQVNPNELLSPDGSDGLEGGYHSSRARQKPDSQVNREKPSTRQADPSEQPAKRTRKPVSEESKARAAETREAKRQAAIAEAAGRLLDLPAVVTSTGQVLTPTLDQVDALLDPISGPAGSALTVDVEHTGYPVGHRLFTLRTVQLGNEHLAAVLDPSDPDQADVIRRHLADADVLHAHSATADLVPLAAAGLVDADAAWAKMIDTGILAKLADPSSTGNDADLKSLSKTLLGDRAHSPEADKARAALFKAGKWLTDTEVTTPIERSGWAQADARCETMIRYAASDVLDDAAIARSIDYPAPDVLAREREVQRMTARVTHRGIRLDGDHVAAKLDEHTSAREARAERVRAFGIDNPGSNDQVGLALAGLGAQLPATRTGKPSVAKGVLEPLEHAEGTIGDLTREVLAYRHHATALSLLLEPYHELVTQGDGRARPTVYTLGADTGRMSSSRPNVQQVSREGGMRACFTADPGYLMVSADFASVEIRVAAALSQDRALMQMLLDGTDLHGEIARLVWGPTATKAHRYKAKRKVFGRIYGQGVDGMARTDGAGREVAQAVIDALDALTPGLTEWSRMVRDGVDAGNTKFQTYAGRIVHLPKTAPHAAPNYCIQGTARELLVDALLRWRETPWGGATLFPVHDELVVMVPEHEAAEATAALEACMTTELYGVSIVAEASKPSFYWEDSA